MEIGVDSLQGHVKHVTIHRTGNAQLIGDSTIQLTSEGRRWLTAVGEAAAGGTYRVGSLSRSRRGWPARLAPLFDGNAGLSLTGW